MVHSCIKVLIIIFLIFQCLLNLKVFAQSHKTNGITVRSSESILNTPEGNFLGGNYFPHGNQVAYRLPRPVFEKFTSHVMLQHTNFQLQKIIDTIDNGSFLEGLLDKEKEGFFPVADINFDDGLVAGIGYKILQPGDLHQPSKTMHKFYAAGSVPGGALLAGYNFEKADVWGTTDLLFSLNGGMPAAIINFFGYGNNTLFDKRNTNFKYVHTHRHEGRASLSLRLQPGKYWEITPAVAAQYDYIPSAKNIEKNISEVLPFFEKEFLFRTKYFAGTTLSVQRDSRSKEVFEKEGSLLQFSLNAFKGLNNYSNDYAQLSASYRKYFLLSKNFVLAARIGAGINAGDFEYYQSQFLSVHTNLRGYRRYRFAGEQMVYGNIELRYKVNDFSGSLLSGSWGWAISNDIGRVWIKNEDSDKWHNSIGPGVWLSPGNKIAGMLSLFFNKENIAPYVSVGFYF